VPCGARWLSKTFMQPVSTVPSRVARGNSAGFRAIFLAAFVLALTEVPIFALLRGTLDRIVANHPWVSIQLGFGMCRGPWQSA
jgi:hypothetical protein